MKSITIHIITLLIAVSCGSKEAPATEQATASVASISTDQEAKPTSRDESTDAESMTISIQMTGYIDVPPANRASISPYYGGFVEKISVLPGQAVKKGEVLLVLRNPEYIEMQQAYLEAFEQLEYLKSEFERQQTLEKENISSTKVMMKAESDYRQMVARANAIKEKLKLMGLSIERIEAGQITSAISLRAPLNGTVSALNVTNGEFVDARAIALELINTEHIHLELDAFEKDALWISEGQTFEFRIPELSTEAFEGEVYLVNKSVDLQKRTVKIHGHIANEKAANFLPGMFVEANLKIEK